MMKATVDKSGCIGCGLCASICPEVFRMDEDGLAEAILDPVPPEHEDSALEARDSCPTSVITME